MAIETDITHRGQATTETLNGKLRLDEGNGRLVVYSAETGKAKLLLGMCPDGKIRLLIAVDGQDVIKDVFV